MGAAMSWREEIYLASIKPKYAYRIFAGSKKFELRKWIGVKPNKGSTIVVYVSGNVRAIVGEFRVGRVIFAPPDDLWNMLMSLEDPGVSAEDYQYIRGARYALALEVLDPLVYIKPITLKELRRIIPGFNPPLSMREASIDEPLYELVIRKAREATLKMLSKKSLSSKSKSP